MTPQMGTILYIVVFIAIFYFLLIRPQSKARKERTNMMSSLQVNDKIYSVGGIVGTITKMNDTSVWVRIAKDVEIELLRTGIGGIKTNDEA